jgi:hypothetical protein
MSRTRRWAGAATPTQRNTTQALDRANQASDVINISNCTSENKPRWAPATVPRSRPLTVALVIDGRGGRSRGGRLRHVLDWLAYFLRRRGDQWFGVNDAEADWWGWQITEAFGGLGRRYRDVRFDTLAACARCTGAGVWADAPCEPCLGTGRINPAR